MNTGIAMVITAQQPPTANTVNPTSTNASGAIRQRGTAPPIPLMRISNNPNVRLASLSIRPKPTTTAMVVIPLTPEKNRAKYSPTVIRFCITYSKNCTTRHTMIPWSKSLSNSTVPPTSAASGIIAFQAEETLCSSTSSMSTSFSCFSPGSKAAPPEATR